MGIITVFLIVLVAALGIGNALLSFSGRRAENPTGFVLVQPRYGAEITGLKAGHRALSEKINMAHSRLNGIEAVLAGGKGPASGEVGEKLRRLDHFRANTQVELQAIQEILLDLQKGRAHAKAKVLKPREKPSGGFEKEMHRIIYRQRGGGAG